MKSPSLPSLWGIVTIQMPATLERPLLPSLCWSHTELKAFLKLPVLFCYTQEWKEKKKKKNEQWNVPWALLPSLTPY